jgi:hypothetical protein
VTEYLIFDNAFIVAAAISTYLSFHLYRKYKQRKISISLWFFVLFAFSAFGYFFTWLGLFTTGSYAELPFWVTVVSNSTLIISSSLAFAISLLLWRQDYRLLIIPLVIAILDLSIVLYALNEPTVESVALFIRGISLAVVSVPVLIMFFHLYRKTNSGKSLSFSAAWLVLLVGGFAARFISLDFLGIALVLAAVILLLGMTEIIDKYVLRNPM